MQTRSDCERSGFKWESKDGNCFVREVLTRSLGETILELGTTFKIAVDFRDQILDRTPIGKRFLNYYYSSLVMTFAAVRENYSLIGSFIETWLALLPWVKGMLEANGEGDWHGKSEYAERIRFTQPSYRRVISLIDGFRSSAPNEEYIRLLDDLAAEVKRYVGLNPNEALKVIRRDLDKAGD